MPLVETINPYADDAQWVGVGNPFAWKVYKPYSISWLQADLVSGAAIMDAQPSESEYYPAEVIGTSGDGRPIMAGWPKAVWVFDYPLNAGQMNQLWFARNQAVGGPTQPLVYITTRVDDVVQALDLTTGFNENEYAYMNFKAFMQPIEYRTRGRYRFDAVKCTFTHLVAL